MKLSREMIVCVLLLCVVLAQCTIGRRLSTSDERAKVIALTRSLEQNPFAENATADRQWLQEWIVEVPDMRFYSCDDLVGHGLGNYPYSREIILQTMFSGAAFVVEHQDFARDETAQYIAGVQGALRMYESMLKSKPEAKSIFLDELLAKRDRGELADHVAKFADENCKRPNTILIYNLAGAGVGLILGQLVAWQFGGRRKSAAKEIGVVTGENDGGKIAKILQWIVFVCAAYYVIVVTALHLLEPEYDPRFWFMSGYALGKYGWLMTTTFFVLGLANFSVAAGLRDVHQSSRGARIGFGLLTVGAFFIWMAGIFKDSLPHLLAGVVVFPSITMAVLLLSLSFRKSVEWRTIYIITLLIALGMLAAFLSMAADVGMPGLQQRAFILLLLLWLSIVIYRYVRVRTGRLTLTK